MPIVSTSAGGRRNRNFWRALLGFPEFISPAFTTCSIMTSRPRAAGIQASIASVTAVNAKAPAKIQKALVSSMDEVEYPTKPLVPYLQTVHDRGVVEIFRGCIRGCRFCQAGWSTGRFECAVKRKFGAGGCNFSQYRLRRTILNLAEFQ